MQTNNGIYKLQHKPFNLIPVPPALTVSVNNNTDANALVYLFNNNSLHNYSNGDGFNNTNVIFGDGFKGKGYAQLFGGLDRGLKCYGFTLNCYNPITGIQSQSALTMANPTLLCANLVGQNFIPKGIVLSAGLRNTQYQQGMMTVKTIFKINPLTQIQINTLNGYQYDLTIMTAPF